ncbi:M4 family metallopeptidase [Rossellomorea aquimaris]|uniref:Neutral metalloproteinase n=1 Tax=Rossellomorea aquimaris TaxID=189382 RepID=A0A5D4TR71_9BACI|nr:M4 family metallopeptidase [Rossellomorea aquimaris]TYS76694.1 peptidase M4 family protein [Rossellomorea aquimaris]TYS83600.1 peptidase M4 family protein [Rossellomorea aquimaris]
MSKKKLVSLALGTSLVFSASFTGATTFAQSSNSITSKMDIHQKVMNIDKKGPSFLSGKLSKGIVKNDKDVKKFLKDNKGLFAIDPHSELTLLEKTTDELGMSHYKFTQSVGGVPVDGAIFIVHTNKKNEVTATTGQLYKEASKQVTKTKSKINQKSAADLAWKHIGVSEADTVADTHDAHALDAKKDSDVESTNVKNDLVIHEKDGKFTLAYKVQLQFIQPYGANWQVYVDATDGSIVEAYNAVTDAATTGYGYGVLDDYKDLNTYYSNGTYYLYDVTKPMNGVIETRTAQNGSSLPGSYTVDSNNAWTAYSQAAEVDAHAYAGKVYDYYKNTHNRNSYDNNGATIRSTVHYGSNYNNAFWNGSQMVYGDGDGTTFTSLSGALDVVAHELTHAVTERTAGLQYQYQSGALNESFSDVFGYFLDPGDYLLGEDIYTPGISGDALRSLSNPTQYGQPAHMNNYVNTSSDNGGVHTNSGIPNKAAYNTISSIGKVKAEKIYYRALTVYLTPTSNFSYARAALLQSTADLYGNGSATYNSVKAAWDAVGVY